MLLVGMIPRYVVPMDIPNIMIPAVVSVINHVARHLRPGGRQVRGARQPHQHFRVISSGQRNGVWVIVLITLFLLYCGLDAVSVSKSTFGVMNDEAITEVNLEV